MNIKLFLNQKIKNSYLKKIVAIFTTTCFLITMVCSQTIYATTMPLPNSLPVNPSLLNTTSNVLIPFNLGRITDSFYADSGDVVINIQDLHSHEQTQRNISSILSILDSKYGLDKVYIEGASIQLNTSWLTNIQDSKIKEKVLNNLLESGRLTGGEYFSIRSDKNTILQGLEDPDIYSNNSIRLKEIYSKEKEIQNYISILTNILGKKSKQYYSKENKKINKIIRSYKNGEIRTDKYIELLLQEANKARVDISKYKSIIAFVKLMSKQKSFDSRKLNNEIKELLVELKGKSTFEEYRTLIEKSTKKEFEVDFYFDLLKKAKDLNLLEKNKYKNTNAFFEYLILNQDLNPIELTKNEKMFIGELTNKLATTENEKNMLFLQSYLESLSNYLTNKMSAQEYESFLKNLEKFKFLWAKYVDIDNITNVTKYINLSKDFYKGNVERNRIFVNKLLGKMPQEEPTAGFRIKSNINHKDKVVAEILKGKKIHVVITGGFHTYGLNRLLEDQNINYIVITPNVTDDTNTADKLYKNIFNEEYEITKTTFANRPITEIVMLLNKGDIKEINPVGNGIEIKYVSGETISLKNIKQDMVSDLDILPPTQAEIVSQAVLDIQDLLKTLRENASNVSIEALSKLRNLESLVESIDNVDIKKQLKSQITTIKENNPTISLDNVGKMILPSTRRILNIFFGFIKNKNVKNRIMSVGSAIIENTFLFPLIIFAPEKFALLHYNKKDRNYIKEILYDLEQLYSIRAQLQTLQDLVSDTKDDVKYQSQLDNLYEQLMAVDQNLNDLDINELDFAIEERENILADCGYTTIYKGTKDMFQSGLAGVVFVLFFAMLGVVGSLEFSDSFSEVWISFIENFKYLIYSFIGSFAIGFYGSHISHNLQIDSKISRAEKSLRSALYDLVDYLPNDVSYENIEDLTGVDFSFIINGKEEYVNLSVILADILNLFDTDFFRKDFMKDVSQELEPLTYKEIIRGIIARGENIDANEYATNINTIIDAYSSLKYRDVALILKNIEESLIVLKKVLKAKKIGSKKNLTSEDKEILKLYEILNNYRRSIKNFKTKYWKLSISDSRKGQQSKTKNKYEVNILGKKYFVEAVSLAQAFNSVVHRVSKGNRLEMYKTKEELGFNAYRDDVDRELAGQTFRTKKARKEAEDAMLENFYKRFIKQVVPQETKKQESVSAYSRKTNKTFYKRKPKSGEYSFRIVVPGINDIESLSAFQEVYARSPRQAMFELVATMCLATENGNLKGGIYDGIAFSKANINEITKKLSEKYTDSQLVTIIKNVRANNAPVMNDGVVRDFSQTQKPEESLYRVVIPNFNDRAGLEYYQYVYAMDKKSAIEKAILAIIKARERNEIRGGYYNYRAINSNNRENILDSILNNPTNVTITQVTGLDSTLMLSSKNKISNFITKILEPYNRNKTINKLESKETLTEQEQSYLKALKQQRELISQKREVQQGLRAIQNIILSKVNYKAELIGESRFQVPERVEIDVQTQEQRGRLFEQLKNIDIELANIEVELSTFKQKASISRIISVIIAGIVEIPFQFISPTKFVVKHFKGDLTNLQSKETLTEQEQSYLNDLNQYDQAIKEREQVKQGLRVIQNIILSKVNYKAELIGESRFQVPERVEIDAQTQEQRGRLFEQLKGLDSRIESIQTKLLSYENNIARLKKARSLHVLAIITSTACLATVALLHSGILKIVAILSFIAINATSHIKYNLDNIDDPKNQLIFSSNSRTINKLESKETLTEQEQSYLKALKQQRELISQKREVQQGLRAIQNIILSKVNYKAELIGESRFQVPERVEIDVQTQEQRGRLFEQLKNIDIELANIEVELSTFKQKASISRIISVIIAGIVEIPFQFISPTKFVVKHFKGDLTNLQSKETLTEQEQSYLNDLNQYDQAIKEREQVKQGLRAIQNIILSKVNYKAELIGESRFQVPERVEIDAQTQEQRGRLFEQLKGLDSRIESIQTKLLSYENNIARLKKARSLHVLAIITSTACLATVALLHSGILKIVAVLSFIAINATSHIKYNLDNIDDPKNQLIFSSNSRTINKLESKETLTEQEQSYLKALKQQRELISQKREVQQGLRAIQNIILSKVNYKAELIGESRFQVPERVEIDVQTQEQRGRLFEQLKNIDIELANIEVELSTFKQKASISRIISVIIAGIVEIPFQFISPTKFVVKHFKGDLTNLQSKETLTEQEQSYLNDLNQYDQAIKEREQVKQGLRAIQNIILSKVNYKAELIGESRFQVPERVEIDAQTQEQRGRLFEQLKGLDSRIESIQTKLLSYENNIARLKKARSLHVLAIITSTACLATVALLHSGILKIVAVLSFIAINATSHIKYNLDNIDDPRKQLSLSSSYTETSTSLLQPLAKIIDIQYPNDKKMQQILEQLKKDTSRMLENEIRTEEEITALLKQLENILNGNIDIEFMKQRVVKFGTAGARGTINTINKEGIDDTIDFYTAIIIAQAMSDFINEEKDLPKTIFLQSDSRYFGQFFNLVMSRVFESNNIQVYMVDNDLGTLPTPTGSFFLKDLKENNSAQRYGLENGTFMAASINVTASHNPGKYNGFKINMCDGAQFPSDMTKKVSAKIKEIQTEKHLIKLSKKENIQYISTTEKTTNLLGKEIKTNLNVIEKAHTEYLIKTFENALGEGDTDVSKLYLVINGNNSVLVPIQKALCEYYGIEYEIFNDGRDTSFDAKKPEPSEENMQSLIDKLSKIKIKGKTAFGMASDPDGDRFCVVDSDSTFITPNQIGLITLNEQLSNIKSQIENNKNLNTAKDFIDYMGVILKSHVTSSEIDVLSKIYSNEIYAIAKERLSEVQLAILDKEISKRNGFFRVENLPVQWKNIADRQKVIESKGEKFLVGIESSGGLSLGVYDKDGALATMLPVLISSKKGVSLQDLLSDIHSKVSFESLFKETSVTFGKDEEKQAFLNWINEIFNQDETSQISQLQGLLKEFGIYVDLERPVVWQNEGLKLPIKDTNYYKFGICTSWMSFRASGTEPKVRVYAETTDKDLLEKYSDIGKEIVTAKGAGLKLSVKTRTTDVILSDIKKYITNNPKSIRDIMSEKGSQQRIETLAKEISLGKQDSLHYDFTRNNLDLSLLNLFRELFEEGSIRDKLAKSKFISDRQEIRQVLSNKENLKIKSLIDTSNEIRTGSFNGKNISKIRIILDSLMIQQELIVNSLSEYRDSNTPSMEFITKEQIKDLKHDSSVLYLVQTNLSSSQEKDLKQKTDNDFIINSKNVAVKDLFKSNDSSIIPIILPALCSIGYDNFMDFLEGVTSIDDITINEISYEKNVVIMMTLLNVLASKYLGIDTNVVLPYNNCLYELPKYIQDLMKNEGVFFGQPGTNGQHSFYQELHQGTFIPFMIFIAFGVSSESVEKYAGNMITSQLKLNSNVLAQADAFAFGLNKEEVLDNLIKEGKTKEEIEILLEHKIFEGNRPSNVLTFSKLTPTTLGSIISIFENMQQLLSLPEIKNIKQTEIEKEVEESTFTNSEEYKNLEATKNDVIDTTTQTKIVSSVGKDDVSFSSNISAKLISLLTNLFVKQGVKQKIENMFDGVKINWTEKRAVLHSALRNVDFVNGEFKPKSSIYVDGVDVMPNVAKTLNKMKEFSDKIISGKWKGFTGKKITNIVSIGIGGSDLGPKMVTKTLSDYKIEGAPNLYFVSNVDPNDINSTLTEIGLNPETTLFIIESKTFTTDETISNARLAKEWIVSNLGSSPEVIAKHFVAVSTNRDEVSKFGIDTSNMFEFWDWVGGRYSVWSAVGLPVMCSIGAENFANFLAGGSIADTDLKNAIANNTLEQNLSMIMAMTDIYNINILGKTDRAIQSTGLKLFVDHIQQLYMESLGKKVDSRNKTIPYHTGAKILESNGENISDKVIEDTISAKENLGEKYKEGMLSYNINLSELNPMTLGTLLALYENMVAIEGAIWDINAFDQWGVELGKKLAKAIYSAFLERIEDINSKIKENLSTSKMINYVVNVRKKQESIITAGKELSEKTVDLTTDTEGQPLIDVVEAAKLETSVQLLKTLILDSIETLQRLTYSFLFKDNMEYTMVAKSDDLSRVKKAQLLAQSGIKVNLVLVGDTSLIKETESRISTADGELAFCLIDNSNKNLTVYGYNDSYGQDVADITVINRQSALIAMLRHINDSCDKSIKILDMPGNIDNDIITADIENVAQDLFTNIGIGKTITKIFADTLKKKMRKTDDMFIKPSLVASNISSQEIDNYGIEQINRLKEQAITTIIISADDDLIQSKSETLKNLLQIAHDNGLKVMFNYSPDLEQLGLTNFIKWISNFNNTINQFKDNGGIDGLQLDLSDNGDFANLISILIPITRLAQMVNEQNVGSFLSVKMPSTINIADYVKIFKDNGIKLVVDYNSQIVSKGIAEFSSENIIINISSDKNGIITISKLSDIFENNKVSMISFDSSILEAIDTTEGFSFAEMSITKLITSIFETTPDGQVIKGINKGRLFVENRDLVLVNNSLIENLYKMYTDDNISVIQVNSILETEFKENISKYELKGFVKGVLEVIELKNVNATDISFDKTQYTNLLMSTLFEYRQLNNKSFENDETKDVLSDVLNVDNFSDQFKPKILEVHNILTGNYSDRVDSVISVLASLKDNTELSSQERDLILEGLLLLLLGYARQDILNVDNLTTENSIANIKAILSAA